MVLIGVVAAVALVIGFHEFLHDNAGAEWPRLIGGLILFAVTFPVLLLLSRWWRKQGDSILASRETDQKNV